VHDERARDDEKRPSLSVVAPTYQRRGALPRFLRPLLADPAVSELVLAVDGSTDGSVEWLREQARADPRIVVLDLPNRGAAAARQAGIEAATGEVVLLLDDDVIAAPGLAGGHARNHADGAHRLVLGYMPNDWRSLPPGRRGPAYLYSRDYERRRARWESDPGFVLQGLWAGNFSLRREDFLRVGMADRMIKRGEEDREFGVRCSKAGIEGRFDRNLEAAHEFERTLAQYRRDCNQAGAYRRMMFDQHEDVLGEDLELGHSLPRPLKALLPRLASDPLFPALARVLTAVFYVGVLLRSLKLEAFAARALGSLETQRGALESTVS
jgi:glycosyltransferase involved in cell wall biosynthesis